MNLKTILLSKMPTEMAIEQLKKEADFGSGMELDKNKRCQAKAGRNVLDDWGDTCEGSQCSLSNGHSGRHRATDGANGWVNF